MVSIFEWPAPAMAGPWHYLDAELAADFRALLAEKKYFCETLIHPDEMREFRVRPLPFWGDWMWVDGLVSGEPLILGGEICEPLVPYDVVAPFLYGPLGPLLIDGNSTLTHDINELKHINIEEKENACDYLRYFCSAVHGDEGPFYIIEEPSRFVELVSFYDLFDLPEFVTQHAKPIVARRTAEGWQMDALVFYGTALFKSRFMVSLNGLIEMTDDREGDDGLPDADIVFDGLFYRTFKQGLAR